MEHVDFYKEVTDNEFPPLLQIKYTFVIKSNNAFLGLFKEHITSF